MSHSTEARAALQPRLDAITEQTRRLVQPGRLEPAERAIAETLPLEAKIAQPDQRLQHFALPDATNRIISSDDVLALGPVILKFFRGRWDPYCSTELEAWRDLYPEIPLLVVYQRDFHQLLRQHDLRSVDGRAA